MKIEIRGYHPDHPDGKLYGTWSLDKQGHAVCNDASYQHRFEVTGAVGDHGHIYYPKDGAPFLRNLPDQYANSSFFWAELIE